MPDLDDSVTVISIGSHCPLCGTSNGVEVDVMSGTTLIAQLEGCRRCRTGVCANDPETESVS